MARTINTILNLQDKFSGKLSKAQKNALVFKTQLQGVNNTAGTMRKNFANVGKVVATGLVAGTVALGAFGASAMKTYGEFEQSMANVAGISGITKTDEAYGKLEQAALEAGKKTTKSAKECADALGYMGLAGWNTEQQITGLMPILRMSEATQADLATTSDLVTDSMSALGIGTNKMTGYLDVLAQANNKSNQTATQLMEAYIGCGGTFNRFGTQIEESSALLGVLANRGMKGSEAGNSMQSLMINLTKKTGESAKAMKELGISAYDGQGKFKGVTNVLKELNEKTKKMDDSQRDMYLTMIGGKTQLTTLNHLMGGLNTTNAEGVNEYEALFKALKQSDGALDTMADTMTNTYEGALARARSALDDFKIKGIKQLEPYITKAINWFAEKLPAATEKMSVWIESKMPAIVGMAKSTFGALSNSVKWLKDNMNWLLPVMTGVVTGMGAFSVLVPIVSLYTKFTAVTKGLTFAQGLMAVAQTAFNTSLLACPITWIAVGIGALGAMFVVAYKKSEKFRNIVNGVFSKVLGVSKKVIGWLGGKAVAVLRKLGVWFGDKIVPKIDKLSGAILSFWRNVAKPAIDWVKEHFGPPLGAIFNILKDEGKECFGGLGKFIEGIIDSGIAVIEFFEGVFTGNWDKAWKGINDIAVGWVKSINGAIEAVNLDWMHDGFVKLSGDNFTVENWLRGVDTIESWMLKKGVGVKQNALGTQYYSGGFTRINERGGEIIDLPSGSRVIPADKSAKMMGGNNINLTVNVHGNVYGENEAVERIGSAVVREVKLALNNM